MFEDKIKDLELEQLEDKELIKIISERIQRRQRIINKIKDGCEHKFNYTGNSQFIDTNKIAFEIICSKCGQTYLLDNSEESYGEPTPPPLRTIKYGF